MGNPKKGMFKTIQRDLDYSAIKGGLSSMPILLICRNATILKRSIMKTGLRNVVAATILGLPALAQAVDITGTVGRMEVNATGSYGSFRVYTSTVNNMCGGTVTEAVINTTDSNYSVVVAVILAAKAAGSTVIFSSTQNSDGTCHLYYVVVK
jgi:hypothetical protein